MTVTENDRIGLLKAIRKEEVCICSMVVISKLVGVVVPSGAMLYSVETVRVLLCSIQFFLLFLREF